MVQERVIFSSAQFSLMLDIVGSMRAFHPETAVMLLA